MSKDAAGLDMFSAMMNAQPAVPFIKGKGTTSRTWNRAWHEAAIMAARLMADRASVPEANLAPQIPGGWVITYVSVEIERAEHRGGYVFGHGEDLREAISRAVEQIHNKYGGGDGPVGV